MTRNGVIAWTLVLIVGISCVGWFEWMRPRWQDREDLAYCAQQYAQARTAQDSQMVDAVAAPNRGRSTAVRLTCGAHQAKRRAPSP